MPPKKKFAVGALYAALDAERDARDLTWKDVAAESKVSASTLTRLSQGKRPDVDSLSALVAWLGVPADNFMGSQPQRFGSASPLAQISTLLHQDPNLTPEGAIALDEVLKSTYARLRRKKSEHEEE